MWHRANDAIAQISGALPLRFFLDARSAQHAGQMAHFKRLGSEDKGGGSAETGECSCARRRGARACKCGASVEKCGTHGSWGNGRRVRGAKQAFQKAKAFENNPREALKPRDGTSLKKKMDDTNCPTPTPSFFWLRRFLAPCLTFFS